MSACVECRYAEPTIAGDEAFLECRRYPPSVVALGDGYGEAKTAFPAVGDNDWCGEWAPQPDPAA